MLLGMTAIIVFVIPVFASTTDGTIDATSKWAWGSKIGWLNFGNSGGNVHVTDSALIGSVWNDLYGWIKLNPSTSGVTNNAEGVLSGYAWGDNIGWIDFSGVTISVSGVFAGTASGTNTGIINFSCTNCSVVTDWRPASSRAVSAPSGGVALPVNLSPAIAPATTVEEIVITTTTQPSIQPVAKLPAPPKISPIAKVVESIIQLPVVDKLKELMGDLVTELSKLQLPEFELPIIPIAKIYDRIKLWTPYFFKEEPLKKVPIETFVAKVTPPSLTGQWEHLDPKPTQRFVFAPLPKDFSALASKFPEVGNTFKRVGINRMSDIEKMKSVQMYLPGLTRAVGLSAPKLDITKPDSVSGVPVADMTQSAKDKIPQEVVFAKAGGQMVDFKIALSLTAKGRAEQKIRTISGKQLQLTVKPSKPVKRVRGFIVFRSLKPQVRAEIELKNLVSSLVFAEPALAHEQSVEVPTEEKLVLLEFEYTDPDGDGIYTADIEAPIPAGEYEIITVMDYEDPDLGSKQIRLITVVDPEGYVYEKIGDKELRVPGAVVTLYYFNPESKKYEEWPAEDFQQENPQITDVRGVYSFLVPGGMYYTQVSAPGYLSYETKPYQVEDGGGIHLNIELRQKNWWLKLIDWRTGVLILALAALALNVWRNGRRIKKCESTLDIKT